MTVVRELTKRKRLIFWLIPVMAMIVILFWGIGRSITVKNYGLKQPADGKMDKAFNDGNSQSGRSSYPIKSAVLSEKLFSRASDKGAIESNSMNISALPSMSNKIIKMASLALKVERHKFSYAFDRAAAIAGNNGGYVAGSNSSLSKGHRASGTITLKVPENVFDKVFSELKKLGKVNMSEVRSQDVSKEYVDLSSRLRHWRAQETVMLKLMEKADTIGDSIAVQNQLAQIQQRIEEITGRLNYLKDQTDMSTIQITVSETGMVPRPLDRWGFKTAVLHGAHAFVDTVNGLIIAVGYMLPLTLIALLIYGVFYLIKRRYNDNAATVA